MIINETEVLVYKDSRLAVPKVLRARAVQWYHHYLQHPGSLRLEETLATVMYWPGLRADVKRHTKSRKCCQLGKSDLHKYGEIPPKIPDQKPWQKSMRRFD